MKIYAELDHEIRLPGFDLPESMSSTIVEELTIYDEDADETHELWAADEDDLVVPRGYAFRLAELADKHGVEFVWNDYRCKPKGFVLGEALPLEPEQERVVDCMMEVEQGIAMAPTGAGKTVICLEVVRIVPGNSIVIVNTKEIAAQWIQRVKDYLGEDYPVSQVGDGKFEIAKNGITVAIQGTLHSRRDHLLDNGFFDQFSLCILDECHHATARTFNEVFAMFNSKFRFGVSATPEKTGVFELAEAVIGPIIVEVDEDDVERIEKPIVEVIETRLGWDPEPTTFRKRKRKFAKMKYETFLKKLLADEERLDLVVNEIMKNHLGARNLVIAKRIELLENIYDELVLAGYPHELLVMVGANTIKERTKAIAMIDHGPCVLLTTLADEALDAPLLEVLHLVWPTSNPELLLQQIGRVRRKHPEKKQSKVMDYRDRHMPPFEKQYMGRRHQVYDPRGFEVTKRKFDHPHELIIKKGK